MIGRKLTNDGCILHVKDGKDLTVLLPNGKLVPGQISAKYVEGNSPVALVEMEIYIGGFNKEHVSNREFCCVSDTSINPNCTAINGTYIRVMLPDGTYLRGERELKITIEANDNEKVIATVLLVVSDVIDDEGNSILVEPGGGSIGESI